MLGLKVKLDTNGTNPDLILSLINDNLLDYPTYTKPEEYRGMKVPSILLSGNHQKIDEYRKSEKIRVTREKRNDLMGD